MKKDKKYLGSLAFILIGVAIGESHSSGAWLTPPSLDFYGKNFYRVQNSKYVDLGNDLNNIKKLADAKFLIDKDSGKEFPGLKCNDANKIYLVRSYYLANSSLVIYKTDNGLIVNSISFSEPRSPEPGVVAICLSEDPKDVRGSISFAK